MDGFPVYVLIQNLFAIGTIDAMHQTASTDELEETNAIQSLSIYGEFRRHSERPASTFAAKRTVASPPRDGGRFGPVLVADRFHSLKKSRVGAILQRRP